MWLCCQPSGSFAFNMKRSLAASENVMHRIRIVFFFYIPLGKEMREKTQET
jgi:hypothetical protein